MNILKLVTFSMIFTFLSGCVSTEKVVLLPESFNMSTEVKGPIAVAFNEFPSPNTYFDGASCLLCIGVAEAAHASLTKHVKKLDSGDIDLIPETLGNALTSKNIEYKQATKVIDLNKLPKFSNYKDGSPFAKKDFTSLKTELNTDVLIYIEIDRFGVLRPYSSYIPTGAPKAIVDGDIKMIDLNTNTYIVNMPIIIRESINGDWDIEPEYPALTNAYYLAIAKANERVLNTLRLK